MDKYLLVGPIYDDSFLAKPDESLKEHTGWVLMEAEKLFLIYGDHFTDKEKQLLKIACLVHDYGKINRLFQEKIKKLQKSIEGEIYHNFLSPIFLNFEALKEDFSEDEIKDLVTAIANHHAREDETPKYVLTDYYEKNLKDNILQCFHTDMPLRLRYHRYLWFTQPNEMGKVPKSWGSYAKLKGLLQKCDYAGSAHIENLEIFDRQKRDEFLEDIQKRKLYPFQSELMKLQDKNVVAVAPTGSGKTEGSFLWIGKDKGFYTLPLRVASNAIYERARKGYSYDEVTILHSNALDILAKEDGEQNEIETRYETTKMLGYPLTITTVDQLFKFPFQAVGHEILFATLTYSKVVIDEIQMYSSTILACIILGLKYLVEQGGKFLITTATLPPIFLDYLRKYVGDDQYIYREFLPNQNEEILRHRISLQGTEFDDALVLEQAKQLKVLVICNTIKRAQEIFQRFHESTSSVFLLHSAFIKKDRQKKEEQILNFEGPGIWVTTQIVEASLDIDFDVLHTDMPLIDNLFQRMGRCYRKRSYSKSVPNIYIYDSKVGIKEKNKGFYDADIYQMSLEEIKKYDGQVLMEKDKLDMIKRIYTYESLEHTEYLNDLEDKIKSLQESFPGRYDKQKADEYFRDIHDYVVIPESVYVSHQKEISDLISEYQESRNIERMRIKSRLLDYTVSIPFYQKSFISGPVIANISRALVYYDEELGVTYEKYNDQFE